MIPKMTFSTFFVGILFNNWLLVKDFTNTTFSCFHKTKTTCWWWWVLSESEESLRNDGCFSKYSSFLSFQWTGLRNLTVLLFIDNPICLFVLFCSMGRTVWWPQFIKTVSLMVLIISYSFCHFLRFFWQKIFHFFVKRFLHLFGKRFFQFCQKISYYTKRFVGFQISLFLLKVFFFASLFHQHDLCMCLSLCIIFLFVG